MRVLEYACVVALFVLLPRVDAIAEPKEALPPVFVYPEARRDDSVIDNYHGIKIADPYRWLEDPDSNETKEFVEAQNNISRPYLDACPIKGKINKRLTDLLDYPKYSCPLRSGSKYYAFKNSGLQNQGVLYVQDTLKGEARVFLDPNTLAEDGTVALAGTKFSEDGNTLAYGRSVSGSDWNTIHFKDAATGTDYPEVLEKVKFSSMSWTKDNKGLFYSGYQTGTTDGRHTGLDQHHTLFYHRLNTSQSEDVVVVEFPDEPFWRVNADVSDCGSYLMVSAVQDGSRGNKLFYADLSKDTDITGKLNLNPIIQSTSFDYDYAYVANEGPIVVIFTNKNAPNYKLIKVDLNNLSEESWQTLVPEHPRDALEWVTAVNKDKLVLHYLRDVKSVLQLHSTETGELLHTFYAGLGSVADFSGKKKQSEIFYRTIDFLSPGVIYYVDLNVQPYRQTVYQEVKVKNFDSSQFEAKQIFYSSRDGTKIPMFIISKLELVRDGSNPVLLYGYGGFNINIQPNFNVMHLVFIQHFNGVVAIPNLRGGGEYGERWHNAGRLLNKQNVFDDFQAAAEYLIEEKYTRPDRLTIQGASNGGLLVAACINQRPDLYGAAIAQVGVMDMLRFDKFTIGHSWVTDFGSPDNKTEFAYLLKYSPLHNIHVPDKGSEYPATFVQTADHDDRVVPLHSLKYIATLQYAARGTIQRQPLLAKIEGKTGHGAGKPTTKLIDEATDIMCFITQVLGLKYS